MRSWIKRLGVSWLWSHDLTAKLSRWQGLNLALALGCSFFLLVVSLQYTLETLWEQAIQVIEGEIEHQADTIGRLLVFEFSHLTELLAPAALEDNPDLELALTRRLWEKVTFNESIRGLELIAASPDAEGRYLTYSYYAAPLAPGVGKGGPQKQRQKFSGPERFLLETIHREQRVDKTLLEAINRGTKLESELIWRYFPLYIPQADRGAIYWGALKVGISREALRRFYAMLDQDRLFLQRLLTWVALLGALTALFLGLSGSLWLNRHFTAPIRAQSQLGAWLTEEAGTDLESLWYHLQHLPTLGISDYEHLKATQLQLAQVARQLAHRLLVQEPEAARGRLQQILATRLPPGHPGWHLWQEMSRPQSADWAVFDPNPLLRQSRQLLELLLPPTLNLETAESRWPRLAGRQDEICQALLLLLDFLLTSDHELKGIQWQTLTPAPNRLQLVIAFQGRAWSPAEVARWLSPARTEEPGCWNLLLAQAIARRHLGELEISPRAEGGLRLALTLPAAGEEAEGVPPPAA